MIDIATIIAFLTMVWRANYTNQSGNGILLMATIDEVKIVLRDALQLGDRVKDFDYSTPLLGSVPELDSMAVVMVLTALEDSFDFFVEDDEISAATFETVGSLSSFVENKLAA